MDESPAPADESPVPADVSPAPRARRRRRGDVPPWVTVLVFTMMACAGVAVWYYGNRPEGGTRLETVESDIAQNLPPGSSRDEVRAWIGSRGITKTADLTDTGGRVNGIQASIPNDTWFDKADIVIHFRFDGEWNLQTALASRLHRD